MEQFKDLKSIRPVGERISTGEEVQPTIDIISNLDKIVDAIIPSARRETHLPSNGRIVDTYLGSMEAPSRRSARMHTLDIRHPETIARVMENFKELAERFNTYVPLTTEFIDTYLAESEADIRVRPAGASHLDDKTIPLWQPMIDGKPVGEKVSAKKLYELMGGTLCDEMRLGPASEPFEFKKSEEPFNLTATLSQLITSGEEFQRNAVTPENKDGAVNFNIQPSYKTDFNK
jgi:hypothetical protein